MIPIVVVFVPQYLPRFLKPNRNNITAAKRFIIFPQNCIKPLFVLTAAIPQSRTGRNHRVMRICPETRSASARLFAYLAAIIVHLLARAPSHLLRFFRILRIASANFIILDLLQLLHNQLPNATKGARFFACSLCKRQKAFITVVWQPVAVIFTLNITTKQ